jgi:hypothetical protein
MTASDNIANANFVLGLIVFATVFFTILFLSLYFTVIYLSNFLSEKLFERDIKKYSQILSEYDVLSFDNRGKPTLLKRRETSEIITFSAFKRNKTRHNIEKIINMVKKRNKYDKIE